VLLASKRTLEESKLKFDEYNPQIPHYILQTLDSSEYRSLRRGFYVTYLGPFSSKAEAEAVAEEVRPVVPDAFVKRLLR
jgi:hypothetical protein